MKRAVTISSVIILALILVCTTVFFIHANVDDGNNVKTENRKKLEELQKLMHDEEITTEEERIANKHLEIFYQAMMREYPEYKEMPYKEVKEREANGKWMSDIYALFNSGKLSKEERQSFIWLFELNDMKY